MNKTRVGTRDNNEYFKGMSSRVEDIEFLQ